MSSEQENRGHQMSERLLASGLLSTVEIERQEKSFVLTLSPIPTLTISPRIMRFCLNFFGDVEPRLYDQELFYWYAAFAEFSEDQTCRVWVARDFYGGSAGFDVLTELVLLGLKLSSTLSSLTQESMYSMEHLVRVYRTKEEVLTFYEHLVTQVIQTGDDLPTEQCKPSLRARWMCCPKHRYLFVQRLLIADWLYYIADGDRFGNPDAAPPETAYLMNHPSTEEMQKRLSGYLAQSFSPQDWLRTRFTYAAQAEREHWHQPIKQVCQRSRHISFTCCQFHRALLAIDYLLSAWLEHFNDIYHMRSLVDEQGHISGLLSANGIAFLIHLAKLDTHDIAFTTWFQSVPSVDISKFHFKEER